MKFFKQFLNNIKTLWPTVFFFYVTGSVIVICGFRLNLFFFNPWRNFQKFSVICLWYEDGSIKHSQYVTFSLLLLRYLKCCTHCKFFGHRNIWWDFQINSPLTLILCQKYLCHTWNWLRYLLSCAAHSYWERKLTNARCEHSISFCGNFWWFRETNTAVRKAVGWSRCSNL